MTPPCVRLSGRGLPAAAKINLALHVTAQRADGYHTLSSLVAFAEIGDRLSFAPADVDSLEITGRYASVLEACPPRDNIILKALAAARAVAAAAGVRLDPVAVHLDKQLPVASGIGGGSADAAAVLALVASVAPALRDALRHAALSLGADVPMCLDGVPAHVEGVGEVGRRLAEFPGVACVLVNPGIAVSTPDVFRALNIRANAPLPALPPLPEAGFADLAGLASYLRETRNDLEPPAMALVPVIAEAAAALRQAGAVLQRMSGSGATVFGLFDTSASAQAAAEAIAAVQSDWWVVATRLKPASLQERPR